MVVLTSIRCFQLVMIKALTGACKKNPVRCVFAIHATMAVGVFPPMRPSALPALYLTNFFSMSLMSAAVCAGAQPTLPLCLAASS
jgi:hypothetical protein